MPRRHGPEASADRVIGLYQEHAAAWLAARRMDLFEKPWLDAFRDALPAHHGRILDLGCGGGRPMAAYLSAQGHRITGIDAAAAMVDQARAACPGQTWLVADMRFLPALGRFDGVVAWHSLFHLRPGDQRPMFRTFARLARPGGALLFTSGPSHGTAVGKLAGQPLYHASLDAADYRACLQANGFEVLRHRASDPGCGGATVWLARKTGEGRRGPDRHR